MIGFLTDRGESCCSYCGARDHGYEDCNQLLAILGSKIALPAEVDVRCEPYRRTSLLVRDQRHVSVELMSCGSRVNQEASFCCSYCGTSRVDITPETDDTTEVSCATCKRPMGTWFEIKRQFWHQAGGGIFSVEHGQFLRIEEFTVRQHGLDSPEIAHNETDCSDRHPSPAFKERP